MSSPNIAWLFDTQALKIAPAEQPFWYTSGLIGPYYINTHFLCGGEAKAKVILDFIDQRAEDYLSFPGHMLNLLRLEYDNFPIYHATMDALVHLAQKSLPLEEIDYIAGGQRRDWFFAPLLAKMLGKSCLYIYNDLTIRDEVGEEVSDLNGVKVLNVADLLTVGSSFTKKWVAAIAGVGGQLLWGLNVVDRLQGGEDNLRKAGAERVESLFRIEGELFEQALSMDYIDIQQYALVQGYLADPFGAMRSFLLSHPEFLENAATSADPKTRTRAEKLIGEDLYKLG